MATLEATNIVIIDDALITAKGSILELEVGEALFREKYFSATDNVITLIDRRGNTEDPTEPVSLVLPLFKKSYTIGQRTVQFADAKITIRLINDTATGGNPSTLSLLPSAGQTIGGEATITCLQKGYQLDLTPGGTVAEKYNNKMWIPQFATLGAFPGGSTPEYSENVVSVKLP
jgi:hypothetical protein